jgi:hypothetical protein
MIELEIYAVGLRNKVPELRNQMDLVSKVRYKIDSNHDIAYFEADAAEHISLEMVTDLFTRIGLNPRVVGAVPEELGQPVVTGKGTVRLV